MDRPTFSLHHITVAILLLSCVADCLFLKETDNSRQKRGFRKNSAARVAHGYGKRGYSNNIFDHLPFPELSEDSKELPSILAEEAQTSPILSTQDFSRLIQSNDRLADVIVRKFIDINDDGIISTDELFRSVRE